MSREPWFISILLYTKNAAIYHGIFWFYSHAVGKMFTEKCKKKITKCKFFLVIDPVTYTSLPHTAMSREQTFFRIFSQSVFALDCCALDKARRESNSM